MNTTLLQTSFTPSQPVTELARMPSGRSRNRLIQRAYACGVGCGQLVVSLVWMAASLIATAAGVAVAVFVFAWLLMLPLILAGGLIQAVADAVRWI